MNNEIEDSSYEENPHGTLTSQRLIALVLCGVIAWAILIQAAMFVWEVL